MACTPHFSTIGFFIDYYIIGCPSGDCEIVGGALSVCMSGGGT